MNVWENVTASCWHLLTVQYNYKDKHYCATANDNLLITMFQTQFTRYSSSVHNTFPAIYVISCVEKKNGKKKIVSIFFAIKLYFCSVNVLNDKTIIIKTWIIVKCNSRDLIVKYPTQPCGISSDFSQLGLRLRQLSIDFAGQLTSVPLALVNWI